MCSRVHWCALGLTRVSVSCNSLGVLWDTLLCPGTYWYVLALSGMSLHLLVCCAANLNREPKRLPEQDLGKDLLCSISRSKASDSTMQS